MWKLIPLGYQILIVLGVVGLLAGGLMWWHHDGYKEGYAAAMAEVKAADEARKQAAAAKIEKNRGKHAAIREENRAKAGYNAPVSPIVGAGVDRLYQHAPAATVRSRPRLPPARPPS